MFLKEAKFRKGEGRRNCEQEGAHANARLNWVLLMGRSNKRDQKIC